MQHQGTPQFIDAHAGIVKGVAFHPKKRYQFCSGGSDGKVNVFHALSGQQLYGTRITSPNAMKNITAVKFNADGSRILSTTSKRLSVIDTERGVLIGSYDNCAYSGKDKAALASDPQNPHLTTCGCLNGRGWITFDLRKQQPAVFALNVHSSPIKDIIYLDGNWPFCNSAQGAIVSLSSDGVCMIRTIDNQELVSFDVKHRSTSVTATPAYSNSRDRYLAGMLMIGGDNLSGYQPSYQDQDAQLLTYEANDKYIQKLKYSSNGHLLYAITSSGQVGRYARLSSGHVYLGELFSHNDEINDMDVSPNDEYLVTAARNGQVGVLCLGAPSHGWTGYMQLA